MESREESGDFSREEKRENEDSQQLLTALLPPKPTSFWKKMVVFTKLYRLRNIILEIVDSWPEKRFMTVMKSCINKNMKYD